MGYGLSAYCSKKIDDNDDCSYGSFEHQGSCYYLPSNASAKSYGSGFKCNYGYEKKGYGLYAYCEEETDDDNNYYSSYYSSIDTEKYKEKKECVKNASLSNDGYCYCDTGYKVDKAKTSCITDDNKNEKGECKSGYFLKNNKCINHTEDCKDFYGNNVIGTKGVESGTSNCSCKKGYIWKDNYINRCQKI